MSSADKTIQDRIKNSKNDAMELNNTEPKYKVTEWATWLAEKDNFIDFFETIRERRSKFINFYIPSLEECKEHPEEVAKKREEIEKQIVEYDAKFPDEQKEINEIWQAIVKDVREHGYRFTGSSHQYRENCAPIINNKYKICLSQRNWGAIMYEAYPEEDYSNCKEGYEYVKWAWTTEEKEIFP